MPALSLKLGPSYFRYSCYTRVHFFGMRLQAATVNYAVETSQRASLGSALSDNASWQGRRSVRPPCSLPCANPISNHAHVRHAYHLAAHVATGREIQVSSFIFPITLLPSLLNPDEAPGICSIGYGTILQLVQVAQTIGLVEEQAKTPPILLIRS